MSHALVDVPTVIYCAGAAAVKVAPRIAVHRPAAVLLC